MVDLTNHLISIVQPSTANTAPQPTEVSSPVPTVMAPEQESTMTNQTTALVLPTFSTSVPTNRQKDTTHTKLFVGGLPYHTTDKTLKEHFQAYGEIDEAVVITDRSTGKSKGYGFVIMSTKEEAEAALQEPNPIIEGRKANVNLAILGAKPRGNAAPKLPITAISPEFASLLGGQYGSLGIAAPQALAPAPYAVPTTLQAAATAYQLANPAAPGKARSSMNLSSISGRQPVQQQAVNPYLQQLYAVAALQQQQQQQQLNPQMLQVMQGVTTGNPLLDMYAAQTAAAAGQLIPAGLPASGASTPMNPAVTQSLPIDTQAAGAQMAWGMLGYPNTPVAAQALPPTGLSAAAVEYAAAAGPTTAAGLAQQQQQQQQQDSRYQ